VLLVLSLAMLTLYFREPDSGPVHSLQRGGLKVLAPLQTGTSKIISPFREAWHWVGDLFGAQSENDELRKENARLRRLVARDLLLRKENQDLRSMVGVTGSAVFPKDATLVPARVISRSAEAWYSTVIVNVGTDRGVRRFDAVVDQAGNLAGRITDVSGNAAKVTLITDQSSSVAGTLTPSNGWGILQGSLTGAVTMEYVAKSFEVKKNDWVVTAGTGGSTVPRGILIGVVEGVGKQDEELYQSINVRPFADFRTLEWVMVVTT